MFEPRSYREACDKLTLDTEKIEEMITMTENSNKKTHGRPARVALVAAAMAAALCVTAAAAELPAVKEFFATVFVTVATDDGLLAGKNIPTMAVEEREGRTYLLLDDQEIDVTDDIADGGEYLYEGEDFTVRVDSNGEAVLTAPYGENGESISFSTKLGAKDNTVVYNVTTDASEDLQTGVYEIETSGNSSAVTVTAEDGQVYDYQWDGVQIVPAEIITAE